MARGRGRPEGSTKQPSEARNYVLTLRLNPEDLRIMRERAAEAGMNPSGYVRFLIRNTRIRLEVLT